MELEQEEYVPPIQPADSYNGAKHESYTWSQSISDLDILVNVPGGLTNSADLRVDVSAKGIKVEARTIVLQPHDLPENILQQKDNDCKICIDPNKWTVIFQGELSFTNKKDESLWSLAPGEYVNIHLEKAKERWWEALIIGETKIELSNIDCSRNLYELGETEQMKIGELMWNQRQKILNKNKNNESESKFK